MSDEAYPELVFDRLKDLHRRTDLTQVGQARVAIAAPDNGVYAQQAQRIQQAIEEKSGVRVPIVGDAPVADGPPASTVPVSGNLIALGNRSTNRTLEELYNRHYCLLDLRYPGPGGHVVRSVHDPFGNGANVLLVGGSDPEGVAAATDVFVDHLAREACVDGALSVGWIMEIALGEGVGLPGDLRNFEIWEASAGYGSVGYFGWNSLSKRMAAYYMTGDEVHAREFLRLAFPDEQAKAEIAEIDGERIENKDEPLSGPYHYNAHMMVLYWDLIEESPVFTDEQRLRITNALARQFFHAEDSAWRRQIWEHSREEGNPYAEAPPHVGTRHGQWSAISLYCLCRYFQKYYPDPLWQHGMDAARWHFASLREHAWVGGENDNLYWFNTGVAPILSYLLLTGEREPLENGVLTTLLRGLDTLISGREPDWALNSASLGFLHKAAYLTGDGRFLEYARRTGVDLTGFRLGQSFAASADLPPRPPAELTGQWTINPMPEPMWQGRNSGLSLEESFLFGSFRSAADASGDFVLVKGMNGESRNSYHTYGLLELRMAGQTVLQGFLNQVRTCAGGLVEPVVAMDASLLSTGTVGQSVFAVARVPGAAFCTWRRSLVQRLGRYALVVDALVFDSAHDDMEVELLWEGKGGWKALEAGGAVDTGESGAQIHASDPMDTTVAGGRARMVWRGSVTAGEVKRLFSLVAPRVEGGDLTCAHVNARGAASSPERPEADGLGTAASATGAPATSSDGAPDSHAGRRLDGAPPIAGCAALSLPEPALAVVGEYEGIAGDLVILAGDHLSGVGLVRSDLGGLLIRAEAPVHVDWDFASGVLEIVTSEETKVHLGLADGASLRDEAGDAAGGGTGTLLLPTGRHSFSQAHPQADALATITERAESAVAQAATDRARASARAPVPSAPQELPLELAAELGDVVTDLVVLPGSADGSGGRICVAVGSAVHVLSADGDRSRTLNADGPIRVLHWWPEPGLLLAGCVDEQVIAFDVNTGARAWVFRSQMDPAVFRAAKTYWFKSAPGHEGIHGLHSGTFLDGQSQAFVGSACTLEVLDAGGRLAQRIPVFWGPGHEFALIDGDDGSANLLIAREPTDSHALAIVNSRTLDAKPRGYHGVPAGHTSIGGWACMSRDHILYEDVNGDGEREVVSEINGTWNRIGVWSRDGTPLHNAQLGPGDPIPARTVRDLCLADLAGDGTKHIISALASGVVLSLDCQCQRVWSRRLSSPPTVLACVGEGEATRLAVGLEDGRVVVLDGQGREVGQSQVKGKPVRVATEGVRVVLGTDGGQVGVVEAGSS